MPLSLSKNYVGTMWVLLAAVLVFVSLITWAPFVPATRWDWGDTAAAYAICVLVVAFLGWSFHRNRRTLLAQSGVSQPSLRGPILLRWSDVRNMGVTPTSVTLTGADTKVVVVTAAYQDPAAVAQYITDCLRAVGFSAG